MIMSKDIIDVTPSEAVIDQQRELNYKIWKKNSPILYDFISTNPLDWPSLTLQWFPDIDNSINNTISQRLLLSSYSSGYNKFESLQLYQFKKSNYSMNDLNIYNDHSDIKNEFITSKNPTNITYFNLLQKIPHTGDINKARYMPQNPNLIATTSNTGDILIFDRTKKPNSYDNSLLSSDNSDITLKFHTTETWGLDWNKFKEGELISGSNDGMLAIWNITKFNKSSKSLTPNTSTPLHSMAINSLQYSYFNENLIGTIGDDTFFKLIDSRTSLNNDPMINYKNPLKNSLTCLDFNPFNQFGLSMADVKGNLLLFDLRSMDQPISAMKSAHKDSITSLKWNPEFGSILLSTSSDSTAKLWNFNKPSGNELIFTHGGHLFSVNDADWNPNDSTMVASCSDDNSVQIWKPSRYVFS